MDHIFEKFDCSKPQSLPGNQTLELNSLGFRAIVDLSTSFALTWWAKEYIRRSRTHIPATPFSFDASSFQMNKMNSV